MGKALDVGAAVDARRRACWRCCCPSWRRRSTSRRRRGRRHKDVWEHTKQVVRQSVPKPLVRWAALLHDIGKVPTRVMLPDGRVTFHRHAEVGRAHVREPIARRLGFDKPERHKIRFLILHHLRANAYEPSWTDAAVRRFDHEMGEHLDDLLDLSRADVTSRRPGRRQEAVRQHPRAARSASWRSATLDARVPPLPPGLGNAIMEAFSLPPSKRDRRPAQAVRGRDRARRAGGAPRRRLLRRVPAQERRGLAPAGA